MENPEKTRYMDSMLTIVSLGGREVTDCSLDMDLGRVLDEISHCLNGINLWSSF